MGCFTVACAILVYSNRSYCCIKNRFVGSLSVRKNVLASSVASRVGGQPLILLFIVGNSRQKCCSNRGFRLRQFMVCVVHFSLHALCRYLNY